MTANKGSFAGNLRPRLIAVEAASSKNATQSAKIS